MSIQSNLRVGRSGSIPGSATNFLGRNITRLTLDIPSASMNDTTGIFADSGDRQTASRTANGPVAKILQAIGTEAVVVMYDAFPTGTSNATWNVFVEGEYTDSGTTDDSNTASLKTRLDTRFDEIEGDDGGDVDVILPGTGTEASRTHTFGETLFDNITVNATTVLYESTDNSSE